METTGKNPMPKSRSVKYQEYTCTTSFLNIKKDAITVIRKIAIDAIFLLDIFLNMFFIPFANI